MTAAPRELRIALVSDTYTPQLNGVARTLQRTTDAMRARGHDMRVFTPSDPNAADETHVVRFASRPFWAYPQLRMSALSTREMAERLSAWRPDVVHVATPFGLGLAAHRAARRLRIPLVSSYHTSLATYAGFYGLGAVGGIGWWYLRWFHNATKKTLCPTEAICRDLAMRGFSNLARWGRGVDGAQFNPAWRSDALRASWGASPSTTVIAYVGRLAAEKGIDVALASMRALAAERLDVVFVIAGSGPYEIDVRRLAPAGTIFTGQIEGRELSETFASADLFVFPSTTDTFGNTIQEAMASRLAVVAADVPTTREVLGEAGVLVPPNDAAALTTALRAMVEQPSLTTRLRDTALIAAGGRDWSVAFDALEATYREVAAS